ncbi:aldehyde dehydrogenase family protein [Granulicella cerasi]|uniref:Aldehyde dehydrogenase family protein n=1 Tax=Granulicella cerasi TaxID=741063 RepID=A0ABW1ZCF5_9BACT|nr:aldehyde dehydrogenase family protein [Granulicella cerasi]
MTYQTINPNDDVLIKSFPEHSDEQMEEIIARAQSTYENDWSRKTLAERRTILKKAASILREDVTNLPNPSLSRWANYSGKRGAKWTQCRHPGLLRR